MRHEKIIQREDGSRVKIIASVFIDVFMRGGPKYSFETYFCEKGKRTWKSPHSSNDYTWRALRGSERNKYAEDKYLSIVTKEEVYQVMCELWENIKPKVEKVFYNENV